MLDLDPLDPSPELPLRQHFRGALRTAQSLAQGSILAPPPLWRGFILSRTLTMLSAEGGTGKTWLMLAMQASLESHTPLLSTFDACPQRDGRCLFIGLDSSPWDICHQWARVIRPLAAPESLSSDFLLRGAESINLLDPKFQQWISEWLRVVRPEAIFLDNLRQALRGLNENDSTQVEGVMDLFRSWRDNHGATVIFAHHTRKTPAGLKDSPRDSARGSGALHDAVDFHFTLRKHQHQPELFRLVCAKGRDDLSEWPGELLVRRRHFEHLNQPAVALEPVSLIERYTPVLEALISCNGRRSECIKILAQSMFKGDQMKASHFVTNGISRLRSQDLIHSPSPGVWLPK